MGLYSSYTPGSGNDKITDIISDVDTLFVQNQYKKNKLPYKYYYVIDKPTGQMYEVNLHGSEYKKLGEVGLGKNIGDRDVSGGRKTGGGTKMTQSGWTRINRIVDFPKRNEWYGDRFHGYESYYEGIWREVPTGIHGTCHEAEGRVSGGCIRLNDDLEEELIPYLKKDVMTYFTKDKPSTVLVNPLEK